MSVLRLGNHLISLTYLFVLNHLYYTCPYMGNSNAVVGFFPHFCNTSDFLIIDL